jgi:hypothetical protein
MSRSIGAELPPSLALALSGDRIEEHVGATFQLLTTDAQGWASVAFLSVGEVLATGPSEIRLALWTGTTTTGNLTRDGHGTLALVHDQAGYYLRLRAVRGADVVVSGTAYAYFRCRIEDILEDRVGYATLTSGVTFALPDPSSVLSRWTATIAALRGAPDPSPQATARRPKRERA